jgi:hypothetical protein
MGDAHTGHAGRSDLGAMADRGRRTYHSDAARQHQRYQHAEGDTTATPTHTAGARPDT